MHAYMRYRSIRWASTATNAFKHPFFLGSLNTRGGKSLFDAMSSIPVGGLSRCFTAAATVRDSFMPINQYFLIENN